MKNESITLHMKSLIILAFFLLAGFIPRVFAQESVKPENTGGNTGKVRDALFPTFRKDIADLNKRSAPPATNRAAVSKDTKARLFTNYQAPRSNSVQRSRISQNKSKPLPSDSAAVARPDNQAGKQTPLLPNQDGGASPKSKKN